MKANHELCGYLYIGRRRFDYLLYANGTVYPREEKEPDGVPGRAAGRLLPECEGEARLAVPPAAHEYSALAGPQPGRQKFFSSIDYLLNLLNFNYYYLIIFFIEWQKESKEFADAATLADHELQNDAVVYMCWKKESVCWFIFIILLEIFNLLLLWFW